jgi:hypothetical protein
LYVHHPGSRHNPSEVVKNGPAVAAAFEMCLERHPFRLSQIAVQIFRQPVHP